MQPLTVKCVVLKCVVLIGPAIAHAPCCMLDLPASQFTSDPKAMLPCCHVCVHCSRPTSTPMLLLLQVDLHDAAGQGIVAYPQGTMTYSQAQLLAALSGNARFLGS